jgi:flagellar protein FliO/FliZ
MVGPTLKALGALVFVLGVVLLLYFALSRKGFGLLPAARGGQIQIVEMRSLGPKKGLCLVRVRGEEFLLGLGGERIELLTPVKPAAQNAFEQNLQASLETRP